MIKMPLHQILHYPPIANIFKAHKKIACILEIQAQTCGNILGISSLLQTVLTNNIVKGLFTQGQLLC